MIDSIQGLLEFYKLHSILIFALMPTLLVQ